MSQNLIVSALKTLWLLSPVCMFITKHTPPFCLYPPAQMMFGGSFVMFCLYFFHASLQSWMSTVDTFKARSSLTSLRCLVEPHPATKHWVLCVILWCSSGIFTVFNFFPKTASLEIFRCKYFIIKFARLVMLFLWKFHHNLTSVALLLEAWCHCLS